MTGPSNAQLDTRNKRLGIAGLAMTIGGGGITLISGIALGAGEAGCAGYTCSAADVSAVRGAPAGIVLGVVVLAAGVAITIAVAALKKEGEAKASEADYRTNPRLGLRPTELRLVLAPGPGTAGAGFSFRF